MPISTPPSTCPSAPSGLRIVPESCAADTASTRADAGVAVEPDVHRVAGELRRHEGGHAEVADAGRPAQAGRVARGARAAAEQQLAVLRHRGERRRSRPAGRASRRRARARRRSSMSSGAASSSSAVSRRSWSRDLVGREQHGAAVVERRLGAGGAHVVRAGVGVLVEQREVLGRHPELVRRELAQRHHRAGAALLRAGDDHPGAVGVELDVRARGARERRPPADGDADRLVLGQLLAVLRQGGRLLEALARADHVVDLAARALVARAEHVAPAQLEPVHPDRARHLVDVLLERPARLRRRRRAHRAGGLAVGVHEVRRRSPRSGSGRGRRRASRRAGGRRRRRRCRRRCRSRPCRGARRSCRRASRRSRARRPSPRAGGPAPGTPRAARTAAAPAGRALRASAAMCASWWKPHLPPNPPPRCGTITRTRLSGSSSVSAMPDRVSNGTCVEDQTVSFSPCHCATIARGSIGTAWEASATKRVRDDLVGLRHARRRRRPARSRRTTATLRSRSHALVGAVLLPLLVHERRAVAQRGLEVVRRRERLDLELDRVGGGLGQLGRQRGDGRDDLALVADDAGGEQRAVLDVRAVADVRHVGLRQDGEDAGHRARARGVEPRDPAAPRRPRSGTSRAASR